MDRSRRAAWATTALFQLVLHVVSLAPAAEAQTPSGIRLPTPSPTPYSCSNCGSKRKWMLAGTILGFCGGIALFLYCLARTAGGKSVVVGI